METVTGTYANGQKRHILQLLQITYTAWLSLCVPSAHPLRVAANRTK